MPETEIDYLDEEQTTEETIRSRMLERISDEWDKTEGGYIYDSIAPVAIEMVFIGMMIRKALNLSFAQTTNGEYLDKRAEEHGIFRKEAVKATGEIKITGTVGTIINAGLQVATEADTALNISSVEFVTTETVTIPGDGYVTVPIEAVEAGSNGNVMANKIIVLLKSNSNITYVINPKPTTGGTDIESDADLLTRYLEYVRTPGTSGNVQNYRQWALSIPGVSAVHVIPLWNGNGTVKVVILGPEKAPANDELVNRVKDYICGEDNYGNRMAPIGATVTVVSAQPITISISANIIIDKTLTTLENAIDVFKNDLNEYLKENVFNAATIRISKIGGVLIFRDWILDYTDLKINGDTENIETTEEQVIIIGEVSLNEQ